MEESGQARLVGSTPLEKVSLEEQISLWQVWYAWDTVHLEDCSIVIFGATFISRTEGNTEVLVISRSTA